MNFPFNLNNIVKFILIMLSYDLLLDIFYVYRLKSKFNISNFYFQTIFKISKFIYFIKNGHIVVLFESIFIYVYLFKKK